MNDRTMSAGHTGYRKEQIEDEKFTVSLSTGFEPVKLPRTSDPVVEFGKALRRDRLKRRVSRRPQFEVDMSWTMIHLGEGHDPFNHVGRHVVTEVIGE